MKKYHSPLFTPVGSTCVAHIFQKRLFQVDSYIQFYRLTQLLSSTSLKGIIRRECQSFTNHGHAKTPPTVFNPLSLWLTLPRNMGVRHTLWPPSITRAILACPWFAQGLHRNHKSKQQSHSCVTVVCTGHLAKSKQLPRALSAKNANHLQTTDTIKRHQRYSIHYHCG